MTITQKAALASTVAKSQYNASELCNSELHVFSHEGQLDSCLAHGLCNFHSTFFEHTVTSTVVFVLFILFFSQLHLLRQFKATGVESHASPVDRNYYIYKYYYKHTTSS